MRIPSKQRLLLAKYIHSAENHCLYHWKKLEVSLTQNGLPQLQDLYHLPLLPWCSVTAFCILKVPIGMNIWIKAHKYSPKVSQ